MTTIEVKNDYMLGRQNENILYYKCIELEQENKQLKRILQEIYERAINTNITSLDFRDYILGILGEEE